MHNSLDAPSTVAQILDEGLRLFKECFKPLIPLCLASAVLGQIVTLSFFVLASSANLDLGGINPYQQSPDTFPATQPAYNMDVLPQMSPILMILVLVCFGIITVALYAAVVAKIDSMRGDALMTNSEAFVYGLKRTMSLGTAAVVGGILITLGFIALVIPGIILTVLLTFSYISVILDRVGAFKSYRNKL